MALQETTTIPEIQDAIVILRQMNADEQIRAEAWYREKRFHDEASALGSAMRKGEAKNQRKVVKNMRANGFTDEQICLALGIQSIDEAGLLLATNKT